MAEEVAVVVAEAEAVVEAVVAGAEAVVAVEACRRTRT